LFRLVGKTVSGGLETYEPARIYKPFYSNAIFLRKKFEKYEKGAFFLLWLCDEDAAGTNNELIIKI